MKKTYEKVGTNTHCKQNYSIVTKLGEEPAFIPLIPSNYTLEFKGVHFHIRICPK